jgi:hypothetical protein
LAQNSLFHQWCGVVSQEWAERTGKFYTPEQWKIYFKKLFLGEEVTEINGVIVSELRHTSKLDTAKMAEFMDKVDNFCGSELQIFLPLPTMPEES